MCLTYHDKHNNTDLQNKNLNNKILTYNHNIKWTLTYQPDSARNENSLPHYLQKPEINKNHSTNFIQIPKTGEPLQMTLNPYLLRESITSNKSAMLFTWTDSQYSVEVCLIAVAANLISNTGSEPRKGPLHQNWIHRRTELTHTTLDGAAQKLFSVLRIEIKSDWKRLHKNFEKSLTPKKQIISKSFMQWKWQTTRRN